MPPDFEALMRQATALTRSGQLAAAQAAIQAALRGTATRSAAASSVSDIDDDVIDVVATVIGDVPGARPAVVHARARVEPAQPPACSPAHSPAPSPASPWARSIGPDVDTNTPGMHTGTHLAAGLQCDYALFMPTHTPHPRLPLVVMLHGCTQDPADFAKGTRMNDLAIEHGLVVLYPAQSERRNPQRCWNWFKHNHQQRGRGEPALLASLTQEVMRSHGIDPRRVYVAGLSAGGAMAAVLAQAYPELYAAVGVHSGLAAGSAADLPSALAAMRGAAGVRRSSPSGKPVIVFHGDADATVHPSNGAAVIASSAAVSARAEPSTTVRSPGRRPVTRTVHRTPDDRVVAEHWRVHGAPHAWSGGSSSGSYTDPTGPDASAEMLRFFLEHPRLD